MGVANLIDIKLWLEAEAETCMTRRWSRKKTQAKTWKEWQAWYDGLVWREFLKNREEQMRNASDAVHLSGENSMDAVVEMADDACRSFRLHVERTEDSNR